METIWKKALEAKRAETIQLPVGAKVLCVQLQKGRPHIWFTVPCPGSTQMEDRVFKIYITGDTIEAITGRYIGTFQTMGGDYVFHVFEEFNP